MSRATVPGRKGRPIARPIRALIAAVVAGLVLLAPTGRASAVTDRNLTERGQMPPYVDTPQPASHANAMRQERYAAAGGPVDRVVVAFAESLVKTLPLLPGASVRGAPAVLPSGNLIVGSGRGIGYSSLSLHDPVTGEIIWAAPAYLGSSDHLTARTVGPGAYLQPQPVALSDGNVYLTDGYNLFSFVGETGALSWFTPQSGLPPGPQRQRDEALLPQSLAGDMSVGLSVAPAGIRSPSGGWLIGGVYSRGSINYFDTTDGEPLIVKSAESQNRTPSCLATDAGSNPTACSSFGYDSPLVFAVVGFICFPSGEISKEIDDWCQGLGFTRYFSVNETMVDPLRNRIAFTYAGTGGTVQSGANTALFSQDFDLLKVWEFVTSNGPGQDGTILTADTDADGFGDAGLEELWLAEIGLNSGSSPSLSESFEFLFGVDGAGTSVAFDADAAAAQALPSSAAGFARVSPSVDHNDSLVICSSETGIARVQADTGEVLWQNQASDLGADRLTVLPGVPLVASGRPAQGCVGFPSTHIDVYQAQFAVGYPVVLMDSLRSLGVPLASALAGMGTVDFHVDPRTGETVEADLRSFYRGSGEANIVSLDSGRFVSARNDRLAAAGSGFLNIILPRRFDVPPTEGGFVISEPVSFRDAVLAQFRGARRYCEEVLQGVFVPDQDGDGAAEQISEGLPIVVAGGPAQQAEQARRLQLAVNKVGYIGSIMKSSLPGRLSHASSKGEVDSQEAATIQSAIDDIVSSITIARDLLLGDAADRRNPATNPDASTQTQAGLEIQTACDEVERSIAILACESFTSCDDEDECTVDSCDATGGLCIHSPIPGCPAPPPSLLASTQNGPWSSPSTWREGRVPRDGDWVEISHQVAIAAGDRVTVGHSPGPNDAVPAIRVVSGGSLTLEDGSVLVARGDLRAAGTVTLRPGSRLQMDSSQASIPTSTVYVIEITPGTSSAHLRLEGTAGAHVHVGSNSAGTHTRITDGGVEGGGRVVADFADFEGLGGAPDYSAWVYWPSGDGAPFRLTDCTFTNSSQVKASVIVPDGGHVELERVSFRSSVVKPLAERDPYLGWHIHETGSRPGARVRISHCDFDESVGLFRYDDLEMENNVLRRGVLAYEELGGAWKSFRNNFIRWDSDRELPFVLPGGLTIEDNVFVVDPQGCDEVRSTLCWNPHFMVLGGDGGASVLGNIWWWTGWDPQAEGDGVILGGASNGDRSVNIYRFERNIFLPNGNGPEASPNLSSTGFTILGSTDNYQVHFSRNTLYVSAFGGCNIGETGVTRAADIGYFKSNLFVGAGSGSGAKIRDLGNAEPDAVLAADADFNASYRLSNGSNYGNGSGKGYQGLSFTAGDVIGANDLDDVDPEFVDPSRTPVTWDADEGGAGTLAGAMDRLGPGGGATVQELLLYLREGFRPQNEALRGAGDPFAVPVPSPDIGAVDLASGP